MTEAMTLSVYNIKLKLFSLKPSTDNYYRHKIYILAK